MLWKWNSHSAANKSLLKAAQALGLLLTRLPYLFYSVISSARLKVTPGHSPPQQTSWQVAPAMCEYYKLKSAIPQHSSPSQAAFLPSFLFYIRIDVAPVSERASAPCDIAYTFYRTSLMSRAQLLHFHVRCCFPAVFSQMAAFNFMSKGFLYANSALLSRKVWMKAFFLCASVGVAFC